MLKKTTYPLIIIGILFFIFGFVTWINSTLIVYLQIALELETAQAILVTFAFYISYAVMAFPSSWVLQRTGYKKGMMWGLIVMALGALVFIPAAQTRTYSLFLTGLFIIGTGLALLQTASNPYVTILGPIESAASRMSFMGICNKGAGALAPLIMGAFLLKDTTSLVDRLKTMPVAQKVTELDALASRVIVPYIVIAAVLVALAVFVYFSALPEVEEGEEEATDTVPDGEEKTLFSYPYLWLGFLALFLYVGVEVMAGDIIQIYGKEGLGLGVDEVKHFTTYTMIFMLIGYLIGIATIPKVISQGTALKISAILGLIFSLSAIFTSGMTSVWSIALLGFANAMIWPALWPLTIEGLGKLTKKASALLIIGIGGGAVIPQIWAHLGESVGFQKAFWILIPCYLFILYFAISGHKVGLKVKHTSNTN